MTGEKLDRILPLEKLLGVPPEEIELTLLHEIRMFYSPIEAGIGAVLGLVEDRMQDQDRVIDIMKQSVQLIDKYIDHIQSYLKARNDLKKADDRH